MKLNVGFPAQRVHWVLESFCASDDETYYYSRYFVVDGCNWRLKAYINEDEYLAVYLELAPGSSPPGSRRRVRATLTLVHNRFSESNKVQEGEWCFHAESNSWGFCKFLPLHNLQYGGFLENNRRLRIIADVQVRATLTLMDIDTCLSCKEGNQASDASVSKSLGPSSCQVAQETENADNDDDDEDAASEECSDDDDDNDDASDEGSDDDDDNDDASEEGTDDDDSSEEDSDDDGDEGVISTKEFTRRILEIIEGPSLVTSDNARNGSSLEQVKSLEVDASQTVENGDMGLNTAVSVTETSNSVLEEIQPVKETMDINGFEVCSSQVESVRLIFERHPDIAVDFRAKNQRLRRVFMSFLLGLIETLCESLEELSDEDLVEADIALTYLKDAGFKVDWLDEKLDQLKENKENERSALSRLQEIEENLLRLKQKCSDLDALAEKEKSELSATRTAMSLDCIV